MTGMGRSVSYSIIRRTDTRIGSAAGKGKAATVHDGVTVKCGTTEASTAARLFCRRAVIMSGGIDSSWSSVRRALCICTQGIFICTVIGELGWMGRELNDA